MTLRACSILVVGLILASIPLSPSVAQTPFVHEVADAGGFVGIECSMTLDSEGNPHIVYWDVSNQFLKYAVKRGGVWTTEIIDAAGFVGIETSIAVDSNNIPHVSYHNFSLTNQVLRYANRIGGIWSAETVDLTGDDVGRYNAIAVDTQNRPHISYYDETNGDLKYGLKNGGWATETVESTNDVGLYTDIAVNDRDEPHIVYVEDGLPDMCRYTLKNAGTWEFKIVDSGPGTIGMAALALDARGFGHVVWDSDNQVQYSVDNGVDAFNIHQEAVPLALFANPGAASIALDSNNLPHIVFYDVVILGMRYGCRAADGTWTVDRVERGFDVGFSPSIAVDKYNNPVIAYHDEPNGDLKFTDSRVHVASALSGVTWPVGSERTIAWRGSGDVDIFLSTDGGASYQTLATAINGGGAASGGEYTFTVPHTPSRFCKVKIERPSPYSVSLSDSLFTIETSVSLLSFSVVILPGGGNALSWQTDPAPQDLAGYRIERGRDGGWNELVALTSATTHADKEGRSGDRYRLYAVNGLGAEFMLGESSAGVPSLQALSVWPNPYSEGDLTIAFATAGGIGGTSSDVTVGVYDVTGRLLRRIVNERLPGGQFTATWDGRGTDGRTVAAGVYFVKSTSAGLVNTTKFVVVR